MVEVTVYGVAGHDYPTMWYNERFRADHAVETAKAMGYADRHVVVHKVNVPFHRTGASHELADRLRKFSQRPDWSDDDAFREALFVDGSVYGQLAQALLTYGKQGKYETTSRSYAAHFSFNDRDGVWWQARVNESGQFYLKKVHGHASYWSSREKTLPREVSGYEVSAPDESIRSE